MSNKQSSIEWLMDEFNKIVELHPSQFIKINNAIEQAKAKHRQEIYQTYINAVKEYMLYSLGDPLYYEYDGRIYAEEYYNKKFGEQDVEGVRVNNDKIIMGRGDNNNPDNTDGENNNTSTTGNISDNIWGGDTSNTTGNINTWSETRTDDDNRVAVEKQIWDKTVNWDKNNTVNDEEQAPYNIKTNVVTSGKTDDGTIATIEITIDIKQR